MADKTTRGRKLRRQTLDELRAEVTVTAWLTLVYFEQVADQEAVLAKAEQLATHIAARQEKPRDGDATGEDMGLLLRTLRRRLTRLEFLKRPPASDSGRLQ